LSFAIALSSEVMEIMIASGPMRGSPSALVGVMSTLVVFMMRRYLSLRYGEREQFTYLSLENPYILYRIREFRQIFLTIVKIPLTGYG
jgi:hypothetical protein